MAFAEHTLFCLAGLSAQRRSGAIIRRPLTSTNQNSQNQENGPGEEERAPLFSARKMS